jgi:hypothetical protein
MHRKSLSFHQVRKVWRRDGLDLKNFGLDMPTPVLARADEVIE